jgi:drug/metabolite transporter (DMT)-like permease
MHISGVLIAIIAHCLIGISLIWDKILLEETASQSVTNYVFWLGAMSVFGSILAVFGMKLPPLPVTLIAFGAGILHLIANYFYYWALKSGEASETLSIMGGFAPIATALIGIPILGSFLSGPELWGFLLMVAGGFLMFSSDKIRMIPTLPLVLLAAGFFGLTNVLQKWAFDGTGFITGYVFFTIGTFACSLFLLIRGKWRQEIFSQSERAQPKNKKLYFINRFISGVGSFLVLFAISRANPAVVSAIAGLRYAIIFLAAYLITKYKPQWLRETFRGWTLTAKSVATILVVAGLILVGLSGRGGSGGGPSASIAGRPAARLAGFPPALLSDRIFRHGKHDHPVAGDFHLGFGRACFGAVAESSDAWHSAPAGW